MVDSEIYYADATEIKRLFAEDNDLFNQFENLAKAREAKILNAENEIDFFIRRKTFWKLALKGHNRKQKKELNKILLKDKFKRQRSKKKKSVVSRLNSGRSLKGGIQIQL